MKKSTSLFFAIVSTMLLAIGAARAAEKFDGHLDQNASSVASVTDGPTLPCAISES
jgi:hypothetical protein